MTQHTDAARLDRRGFLKGASAAAMALSVTSAGVIHSGEAWGLEAKALSVATLATLIQMARDIYPHDMLPDRIYAIAVKDFDEKSVKDAALREMIEMNVADLDARAVAMHGAPYRGVGWEKQRVGVLQTIEQGPLFKAVRPALVVSLYNQKEIWPAFGYEGESASKGGYIKRGFNDIAWL